MVYGETPPSTGWTAYNDVVYQSPQYLGTNATTYNIGSGSPGPASGILKNYATGASTGVTATLSQSGGVVWQPDPTTGGEDTNPGTDAYQTFYGITNVEGVVYYGSSSGWYVDLTFTGLDPSKEYTFATTANRHDATYTNRVTRFTVSGIDAATTASTSGVTVVNNLSVAFNTGYNAVNGYVTRWTDIRPGTDGSFTIRAEPHDLATQYRAYAFSVFMLQEESAGPTQFTLTTTPGTGGTITRNPDQTTYNAGTVVTLTAAPNTGYTFTSWGGDLSGSTNPATITMDGDKSVSATFTQNVYSLTVNHIGIGSVSRYPSGPYHYNDIVDLTATPAIGWSFTGWTGDLTGTTSPASITMDGHKVVTATFTQNEYSLTVNTVGNGLVTPAITTTYHLNDVVTLTAVPDTGWAFANWTGGLTGSINPQSLTIDGNTTVTATFTLIPPICYALTLSHTGQGSDPVASPTNSTGCSAGQYVVGESITLTASPATGWQVSSSTGTINNSSTASTNSLTMPASAHSASVTYSLSTCSTVALTPSGDTYLRQSYADRNYGGKPSFQASPNTSYRQNPLIRWDLSSIPANAAVSAASLTFYVTDGSGYDFNLYNMRRAWVEGTNNDAAGSGASWTYYDAGINAWGTAGAMNTTSDRYDTDLWDATSATFGATGSVEIPLNASGIAAVQGWITTPANNFGLTIQYMGTGTASDYWIVESKESTIVANGPS